MVKIRNFRTEDAEKVCSFKMKSAKVNFPDCTFNSEMFKRLLLKNSKNFPDRIKVAEDDGKIVGYIWFKVIESTMGVFGRTEHIFVDEAYRSSGIGRKLMDAAEDYFIKHDIKTAKLTVTSTNKTAISLYNNMGYEVKRYRMEKDL